MIARTLRAGRLQRRQLAALAGGAIVLVLSGGLCAAAPSGNASQADVHPAPSHRGAPPAGAGEREWAFLAPQAPQSLLLDGVADADLSVLVGARGHVLVSEDAGASWTQVGVPTRRVLCAVAMLDASSIWVVGHDALILFSADGGRNWTVQHDAPEEESPLFDVWFENPRHGIAIGAYGLFLETHDGGETWSKRQLGELDRHLYALTEAADGDLYIAGESGTILRSRDRGVT